jgi:transcriptional regulator with XRE-family HTH domain
MARRQAAVAERVHGAPFAVPLGFTTKVVGADGGLTAALTRLAPDPELVVEVVPEETQHVEEPAEPEAADPSADWSDAAAEDLTDTAERTRPVVVLTRDADVAQAAQVEDTQETVVRPVEATSTPSALRSPISAIRSEVTSRLSREPAPTPAAPAADDTGVWRSETVLVPEMDLPTRTPVIGPQLAEARQALGLDVERLAQRTRIRPHVIEAIERDDFESCGGDFYARGHLRTLARVLGVDATPLLATYDDTYADAPIDPRRVFEAELATGTDGPIRSLRGGANWSVVVAAVMAVVLAWSVARLVVDRPEDTAADTPGLSAGSAGLTSGETALAPAVPVLLTAEGGGAKVVVRDGAGTVVFKGNLAFGQSKTVKASPPVRVQTSDGSLTVGLDGADPTSMGRTGKAARNTFVPPVD